MTPPPIALTMAAVTGLALGSFAVTAGVRFGRVGENLPSRSRCDHCAAPLSFGQTVPLVGYVSQRGACHACGQAISKVHLAGEIAGCGVLVSAALTGEAWRALLLAALGLILIATSAVDWRTQRLPDRLTVVIAGLCLILAWMGSPSSMLEGLIAAAITLAVLLGLRAVRAALATDPGLGLGDVKLLAALALWLGAMTPWAVALAAVLGLVLGRFGKDDEGRIPFGPAIALGGWCVGLGQELALWPMTA